MRLTLRTLLAYLDGLLPAEQRSELDAKVAGSPVAPQLIERIRGVVARPGLAAPRTDGRGLAEDANTVAEFLDNALLADRLEAFERICIDSDIHLANLADGAFPSVVPAVGWPFSRDDLVGGGALEVSRRVLAARSEFAALRIRAQVEQVSAGHGEASPPGSA